MKIQADVALQTYIFALKKMVVHAEDDSDNQFSYWLGIKNGIESAIPDIKNEVKLWEMQNATVKE